MMDIGLRLVVMYIPLYFIYTRISVLQDNVVDLEDCKQ